MAASIPTHPPLDALLADVDEWIADAEIEFGQGFSAAVENSGIAAAASELEVAHDSGDCSTLRMAQRSLDGAEVSFRAHAAPLLDEAEDIQADLRRASWDATGVEEERLTQAASDVGRFRVRVNEKLDTQVPVNLGDSLLALWDC